MKRQKSQSTVGYEENSEVFQPLKSLPVHALKHKYMYWILYLCRFKHKPYLFLRPNISQHSVDLSVLKVGEGVEVRGGRRAEAAKGQRSLLALELHTQTGGGKQMGVSGQNICPSSQTLNKGLTCVDVKCIGGGFGFTSAWNHNKGWKATRSALMLH